MPDVPTHTIAHIAHATTTIAPITITRTATAVGAPLAGALGAGTLGAGAPTHHRRSIRLTGYDYAQAGLYFVTICTQDRVHRFGRVVDGVMRLNEMGEIIAREWYAIPDRYPNAIMDEFVVMPNHIHGIIQIVADGAPARGARTAIAPVGAIVGAYKSLCVHHCLEWANMQTPVIRLGTLWQRNYWEHIVRNEPELNRIRAYIRNNPLKWDADKLNGGPGNVVMDDAEPYGDFDGDNGYLGIIMEDTHDTRVGAPLAGACIINGHPRGVPLRG